MIGNTALVKKAYLYSFLLQIYTSIHNKYFLFVLGITKNMRQEQMENHGSPPLNTTSSNITSQNISKLTHYIICEQHNEYGIQTRYNRKTPICTHDEYKP